MPPWNTSLRPVPSAFATIQLVPAPPSAKPTVGVGRNAVMEAAGITEVAHAGIMAADIHRIAADIGAAAIARGRIEQQSQKCVRRLEACLLGTGVDLAGELGQSI